MFENKVHIKIFLPKKDIVHLQFTLLRYIARNVVRLSWVGQVTVLRERRKTQNFVAKSLGKCPLGAPNMR